MLFDAHTHLEKEYDPPSELMYQLATASTPEECSVLDKLSDADKRIFCACGVHPWNSATVSMEVLRPWMERYPVVGEIGMDAEWCDIDLRLQREVFVRQLHWAAMNGKPIVLHTKGCEQEVLRELSGYPHPILVHWYSSEKRLKEYIDLGCYFTVGSNVNASAAVCRVAKETPADRLMIESDGLSGISWGLGRNVTPDELPQALRATIRAIAAIRNVKESEVEDAVLKNALRFVG